MNILIVLTSNSQMGNTNNRTGFWLEEFTTPYYLFQDAGARVTLASPLGGQPPIDPHSENVRPEVASNTRFLDDEEGRRALAQTLPLAKIDPGKYDALYYPGGHGVMWDLVEDTHSIAIIEAFYNSGKPTALICHAPAALRNARTKEGRPIVSGKRVNGTSNTEEESYGLTDVVPFLIEDELVRLGGLYSKAPDGQPHTVVDGNLVTGQNPASAAGVARALLRLLGTHER